MAKDNFASKINTYTYIKKVQTWWDNIPKAFAFTQVGQILAITNLKRIDLQLASLFKELV